MERRTARGLEANQGRSAPQGAGLPHERRPALHLPSVIEGAGLKGEPAPYQTTGPAELWPRALPRRLIHFGTEITVRFLSSSWSRQQPGGAPRSIMSTGALAQAGSEERFHESDNEASSKKRARVLNRPFGFGRRSQGHVAASGKIRPRPVAQPAISHSHHFAPVASRSHRGLPRKAPGMLLRGDR